MSRAYDAIRRQAVIAALRREQCDTLAQLAGAAGLKQHQARDVVRAMRMKGEISLKGYELAKSLRAGSSPSPRPPAPAKPSSPRNALGLDNSPVLAADALVARREADRSRAERVATLKQQTALEAEAAVRNSRNARSIGSVIKDASFVDLGRARLSAAEAVQTALAETPSDVMRAIRRRWPELWGTLVTRARAESDARGERVLPFGLLIEAATVGLECLKESL